MVSISHENEKENLSQSASECECKGGKEEWGEWMPWELKLHTKHAPARGACRGHVWCGLKLPPNSLLDLFFCVQELATELATARANAFIYSRAVTANKYK